MTAEDLDLLGAAAAVSRTIQRCSGVLDAIARDLSSRGAVLNRADPSAFAAVLSGCVQDLDEADADLQALAHVLRGLSFTPPLPIGE